MASSKVQKWETVPHNVRFRILKMDSVESEDFLSNIMSKNDIMSKNVTSFFRSFFFNMEC